jgi:hypothetical protein
MIDHIFCGAGVLGLVESGGAPARRRGKHVLPAGTGGTRLSFELVETTLPALRLQHVFTGA